MSPLQKKSQSRVLFLLLFFVIALLSVALRLVFIQGVEAKRYRNLALKQHLRCVDLNPRRGVIYDRKGEELAVSVEKDTIYATPYLIKNPSRVAAQLASVLDVPKKEIYRKLTKDSGFSYIARKVDQDKTNRIKKLDIEGIGCLKESKRCYPLKSLGSHVIGFVGTDDKGLAGLELYYDKTLRGKPGKLVTERDPLGRQIPGGIFKLSSPVNGKDIKTTIDKDIQYRVEEELRRCVKDFKAKSGTAIVLNPNTGEIYAMANVPDFNLDKFSGASADVQRNRAVTDTYEPGSTMKVVTATAALEERLVTPQSTFYLPSGLRVADKTITDSHKRGAKNFTFLEIVSQSSNVGAVTLGLKLGKERLYGYINLLGLTKKTGVDLPGEVCGFIPPPDKWYSTTIANVPFGQGISATSLEMAQVISIIANGGYIMKPHLLSEVTDPYGKVIKYPQDPGKKVISSKTCEEMRNILGQVIETGTGKKAKLYGYQAGGKTGTAQKPGPGGYTGDRYITSFIGFAPLSDPQVVVLISIDEPQEGIYGGEVAAPTFKNITEFTLRQLKVPPGSS